VVTHRDGGLVVPNAGDTDGRYRQAEPDSGDWAIVSDQSYGVILGCDYDVTGTLFSISSSNNVVVVDGEIQAFTSASISTLNLSAGSSSDRFDLIGWNGITQTLTVVSGQPSGDPVFPVIPSSFVPIAALYVAASSTSFSVDDLVDKRLMLMSGSRGASEAADTFLANRVPSETTDRYTVKGDGTTTWKTSAGDLTLTPLSTGKLQFSGGTFKTSGLEVTGNITVGGNFTASGLITGSNFISASGVPTASAANGSIYARTDTGQIYARRSTGWAEIYADEYPPGTIITTMLTGDNATDHLLGWIKMDGSSYALTNPVLGRLAITRANGGVKESFQSWITGSTMTIPNMSSRVLLGASGTVGAAGGANSRTLTTANLPAHKHFSSSVTSPAGSHTPSGSAVENGEHSHTINSGGAHTHSISDPGHKHDGLDMYSTNVPTYFCGAAWGGTNKLDALFNDASHTWTVDMAQSTVSATTGITVQQSGSHNHTVQTAGKHSHTLTMNSVPDHTHQLPTESPVGSGQAVDITPQHLTVHYYIKV
jgi:hypothetical protein